MKKEKKVALQPDETEELVKDVRKDYESRAFERKPLEAQWQLNANFLEGNQYSAINPSGIVQESEKEFFWQEREVYNHIAPIYETRLAKLSRLRPSMSVRPSSGDEDDVRTARTATKILSSISSTLELDEKVRKAIMWSELTGSSFYKVVWDSRSGRSLGEVDEKQIFEGEVSIDICPSFEIYPSSLYADTIEDCESIIHAKAVPITEVQRVYGVEVDEESVDTFSLVSVPNSGGLSLAGAANGIFRKSERGHCLVIERYTRPNDKLPEGEFTIVAGTKLLHTGPLPFTNGNFGTRDLPFIRQDCIRRPGNFFAQSVVERIIPVQRAYNAVKNRKHEFLNRIAAGVLAVEDGSVDVENLEQEGLSPGKILMYRQGSVAPRMLEAGRVPIDFQHEEDRLLHEITIISGVSEVMRSSSPFSGMSGIAIQLLIEQDDTRMSVTAEGIRAAIRLIGKHILRLYKEFAGPGRLSRVVGESGEVELIYWSRSDISCDDVVLETQSELSQTPAVRQSMMMDLLQMGLLSDENGKISDASRHRVLEALGYGGWEHLMDIQSLNINRATKENLRMYKEKIEVCELDSHDIHILEHTRFALSPEFERLSSKKVDLKERLLEHVREHRRFESLKLEAEAVAGV